ncbi:MAG: FAD-dependent oxidoreductase [Caulobacteraceae bacterium]|nr:FAD-dependent oxidoreductase [Caulobacter sp.]
MAASRVAVIGAGALGLLCARRLADDGWRVQVHEAPARPGASAIAAGMLAPASEAVLDSAGPFPLLLEARDAWTAVAGDDAWLRRDGALHLPAAEDVGPRLDALRAIGARAERLPSPFGGEAVFTPDDWRLVTADALAWLAGELARRGVRRLAGPPLAPEAASPSRLGVDAVVLAAGWGAATWAALAPEAVRLAPIKGQILRAPGLGPADGPVLRAGGVYLAPDAQGLIVGATMEPGLGDTAVSTAATRALRAAGGRFAPGLADAPVVAFAGVRATTPDGLPLVGPSGTPGVWWAAGARRNGWLLAPLAAEVLAARLAGRPAGPWAARLDPARFPEGAGRPDARPGADQAL